jgi:PAS domain S-box-containing protein
VDELTQSSTRATPKKSIDDSGRALDISNRTDFGLGLVCIHGLDGYLLSVSPAGAKVLGYKPEEMVGRHMHDFLPADVRDQLPAYLNKIQKDGTAAGLMRVMTKSGEERILAYSNICRQESGKPAYVLGHAADITDLKKAEQQLRMAEQRYRYLLQCSSDVDSARFYHGICVAISDGPNLQSAKNESNAPASCWTGGKELNFTETASISLLLYTSGIQKKARTCMTASGFHRGRSRALENTSKSWTEKYAVIGFSDPHSQC